VSSRETGRGRLGESWLPSDVPTYIHLSIYLSIYLSI